MRREGRGGKREQGDREREISRCHDRRTLSCRTRSKNEAKVNERCARVRVRVRVSKSACDEVEGSNATFWGKILR